MLPEPAGLVTALRDHARREPERPAVVFHRDPSGTDEAESLTYAELDLAARSVAARLRERLRPGDRALLQFPAGAEFPVAFLGCLYAGVAAVPAPLSTGQGNQLTRADGIAADAGVAVTLTDAADADEVTGWLDESGLGQIPLMTVSAAERATEETPPPQADEVAFLQYTSGSTSDPRGVVVRHGNIPHNIHAMGTSFRWRAGAPFCSWLPTYHDMGLIVGLLSPLLYGGTAVLMSPTSFVRRPLSWLRLLSRYRAEVSAAPNFAFDLCVRHVTDEQLATLDLSGWRCAINGSEPVAAATYTRFTERFAAAGFRPEHFCPGYGLAESTVFVSGSPSGDTPLLRRVDGRALEKNRLEPGTGDPADRTLVGCGVTHDLQIRIVDPQTRQSLPTGHIGEIWVRGASVAGGYWQRPDDTSATFGAATAEGDEDFLRTGDLGAFDGGELFVTGRIKDLIIVNGRNLYPHDLEREAQELHPLFEHRPVVAFSVGVPDERLVLLQEIAAPRLTPQELTDLAGVLKTGLNTRFGVRVTNVALVRRGTVRKTTSGKVRRRAMRDLFLAGDLDPLYEEIDDATRILREGRADAARGGAAG